MYQNTFYRVYMSSGNIKYFECGDVQHIHSSCPHNEKAAESSSDMQQLTGNAVSDNLPVGSGPTGCDSQY